MNKSRKDRKSLHKQLAIQRALEAKQANRILRGAKSAPEVLERLKAALHNGSSNNVVICAASMGCVLIASPVEEAEFFDWLEAQGLMPKHHINACGKPDYKSSEVQAVIESMGGIHTDSRVKVLM